MKAVIDRVDGELAVLLLGDQGEFKLNIPLSLLPVGCREGVLRAGCCGDRAG
jgi:hypothetical protein